MNNKEAYKDRKYDVLPFDPNWSRQFTEYKNKLQRIFPNVQIEHIGSTSVEGMSGKPCIDVLVIVPDIKIVEEHIADMEQAGFVYAGQFVMENSRLFRVMEDNHLLANIHFFPEGHPHNKEMLDMRDYLRTHPEEVEGYSNIKKELYAKYPTDYSLYRKEKDEYMNSLKERVLLWQEKSLPVS